jgi:hypothetical protein
MPHSTISETSSRTQASCGQPPRSSVMPASPVYARCIPLGLSQYDIRHGRPLWSLTVLVTSCLLLSREPSSGDDTQETLHRHPQRRLILIPQGRVCRMVRAHGCGIRGMMLGLSVWRIAWEDGSVWQPIC